MFSYLKGKITEISPNTISLDVHDIGFEVYVGTGASFHKDQIIKLPVYVNWNQEQGPTFFGFLTELEKKIFLLIISCSGIGPKIGVAILSQLSPSDFLKAVQSGDEKALSVVNGIGAKKAEQMIIQLRDKVSKLVELGLGDKLQGEESLGHWRNVSQVLKSLNYSRQEIEAALTYIRKKYSGTTSSFDELIRGSLSFLAKKM